jgi:hypothetical protein
VSDQIIVEQTLIKCIKSFLYVFSEESVRVVDWLKHEALSSNPSWTYNCRCSTIISAKNFQNVLKLPFCHRTWIVENNGFHYWVFTHAYDVLWSYSVSLPFLITPHSGSLPLLYLHFQQRFHVLSVFVSNIDALCILKYNLTYFDKNYQYFWCTTYFEICTCNGMA